jgi:uncharacterized protein YndB with AHSA1/START domain
MTFELRLERSFAATPEEVFDALVDPALQEALHGSEREGWVVHSVETDTRVGGTSTYVMGPEGGEPDTERRTHSVVERPQRLVMAHVMEIAAWGRTVETELTITFEARDGGTVLTMVQTGFDQEADRDGFLEGWSDYLDTLGRVLSGGGPEDGGQSELKTRHDTL